MITKKEIKKVEKLQKIDRDIQCLKQDYRNVRHHCVCYTDGWDLAENFNFNYDKVIKIAIKNKIRILEKKRVRLLKEGE